MLFMNEISFDNLLEQEVLGMPFGKNDKREKGVEALAIERNGEGLAVGVPSGAGEHGFSGLHPGTSYSETRVAETNGRVYIIIHDDGRGGHTINQFDNQPEAQAFVEELLTRGINQEAIDTYRASKFDFDVSFRPVVHFQAS